MVQNDGPVTTVITAAGEERECDTWEDAVSVLSAGGHVKPGHPDGPPMPGGAADTGGSAPSEPVPPADDEPVTEDPAAM